MSLAQTPYDSTLAASYSDDLDSPWLTQGEIVFVTLLAFVVLLALIMGIYVVCRTRSNEDEAQHQAVDGHRASFVVDIEVTETPKDGEDGRLLALSPPAPCVEGRHPAAEGGAPHVSKRYKLAAIDHMNQISQTGRH